MTKNLILCKIHDMSDRYSMIAPEITTQNIGEIGETFASNFLLRNGFRIVCSNFKVPIGRNIKGVAVSGEIDLIAIDDETLVFVEVKTRSDDSFAAPEAAVTLRKQRQIIRTAKRYKRIFHTSDILIRYDVISIVLKEKKAPKIEHLRGYFNEAKFQKRYWQDD
jgi:putative endonuclease